MLALLRPLFIISLLSDNYCFTSVGVADYLEIIEQLKMMITKAKKK